MTESSDPTTFPLLGHDLAGSSVTRAKPRPPRRWRFGISTLLVLIFLCSCLLAIWHWRSQSQLEALAHELSYEFNRGPDQAIRTRVARQLVHSRSFQSSGLYSRILRTSDGFGNYEVSMSDITEVDVEGRREVYLKLSVASGLRGDPHGPLAYLLVAFESHSSKLSWLELGSGDEFMPNGGPKDFALSNDGKEVTTSVMVMNPGHGFGSTDRTYRMRAEGIELESVEVHSLGRAGEDELLRGMGIDPNNTNTRVIRDTGPESDL